MIVGMSRKASCQASCEFALMGVARVRQDSCKFALMGVAWVCQGSCKFVLMGVARICSGIHGVRVTPKALLWRWILTPTVHISVCTFTACHICRCLSPTRLGRTSVHASGNTINPLMIFMTTQEPSNWRLKYDSHAGPPLTLDWIWAVGHHTTNVHVDPSGKCPLEQTRLWYPICQGGCTSLQNKGGPFRTFSGGCTLKYAQIFKVVVKTLF